MKQMISRSFPKEFAFPYLLTGEKSKSYLLGEATSWIYKLFFKSIVCISEASLYKQ